MRNRVLGWAWLPLGLLLGLAAARAILAPRVVKRSPATGASVPATAEIRITFSQAMDEDSVLQRLHITPPGSGLAEWEGSTLIYRSQAPWPSGERVGVRLDAGARSLRGLGTLVATRWGFDVARPRVTYLWPADGPAQVYARALEDSEAVALTAAPGGVSDYSIGGRGTQLVYVARSGEVSTEVRGLDLVTGEERLWFACPPGVTCSSPEISADGTRVAFVETPAEASQAGTSRVWLVDKSAGGPAPISAEADVAAAPFWSPQGWLAFADSTRGAILVVNGMGSEPYVPLTALPSVLGERGSWSPDGELLIYPDLALPLGESRREAGDESSAVIETHLFGWEVASGELTDLTAAGGTEADDASPTFTPNGEWVLFSRRLLSDGAWSPGRQLWRMRPDGSQAEPLTEEPSINHGAPSAGPRDGTLAYLRFDLEDPAAPAQIWWLDAEARTGGLVAKGGYLPGWIP